MTKTSKTIVFFGSGPVAAESLRHLNDVISIELVVTKPIPPHHHGVAPVERLANELGLKLEFASTKSELDALIDKRKFKSDLGIIVDYGVIVSQHTINSFKLGILNSHFSILPEWRGADPITFSILSGQKTTGVSLMLIESGLDTGNLLAQQEIPINKDDTTSTLTDKLIQLSSSMLQKYVPIYIDGLIKPYPQKNPDRATYSRKINKKDAILDSKKTAQQLEQEVRAFMGWPGSKTTFNQHTIIVKKAHTNKIAESKLDIKCADGNFLCIDELIAPSGKRMSAKGFLNGYA